MVSTQFGLNWIIICNLPVTRMALPRMDRWVLMTSLVLVATHLNSSHGNRDAKRLYDDLMMNGYNKFCRPVRTFTDVTMVKLGLSLEQIVDVDELNQILTVKLWVEQDWQDVRFIWDKKQYNNITMLHVPIEKIWRPDIVLYNNADGDYTVTTVSKAVIMSDGHVKWNPPMQFKSSCEMNVEYFPFDEQICSMKFGPWTHDITKVDIIHKEQKNSAKVTKEVIRQAMSMDKYEPGDEWDVMEVVARKNLPIYPCCVLKPFADVTFEITLKRRPWYYIYNLLIPCTSIVLLTCLSFYLPSYSGAKISTTISVFLSLSVFQLLLMELVPSTSLKLPLIGKHILATWVLSTSSIILNTSILFMNYRATSSPEMSELTRWLFFGALAKILLMRSPMVPREDGSRDMHTDQAPGRQAPEVYTGAHRRKSIIPLHKLPPFEHTSFIGLDSNKLKLDKICDACVTRNMSRYQPVVQKGLESGCFIARHYSFENDSARVTDEWRFVAQILDRILLWTYIIISGVTVISICLNAPALYDNRTPLTNQRDFIPSNRSLDSKNMGKVFWGRN